MGSSDLPTVRLLSCYIMTPLGMKLDAAAPKCEARTAVEAPQRGRNKRHGRSCAFVAKVEIAGKKLCIRHAERHALCILMGGLNV